MSKLKPSGAPVAPTEDEIKADIARQCAALGIKPAESKHDRVLRAVCEIVAREKRQAKMCEINAECGFDAAHNIGVLIKIGLLIRIDQRSGYIPRVTK